MRLRPKYPACGDCKHGHASHTRFNSIQWCRVGDCMCRGYVIDAEAD